LDVLSAWAIIKSEVPLFWVGRKVYVKNVLKNFISVVPIAIILSQ
jgi:hypothetical protein